jgi:histone acetyltransferase (RNA polymerase elongator complex component)
MPKNHYIIPIFVPHGGCPHQCVFCNQKRISGQQRVPTGQEVEIQINQYLRTIGDHAGKTVEVAFFGGSFTALPVKLQRELIAPARSFWQSGRVDYLRISTRPDCLDRANLEWLYAWGVRVIELGVQSMASEVLAMSKRGHTAEAATSAAALVQAQGFQLGLQMMVGLPGDDREKALNTARQLAILQPDFVRIYPVLVIKDTELAELYQAGQYLPWDLLTTIEVCRDLLKIFTQADIPVIRIGLQTTEQINLQGDVIAGPFHPALRELVEAAWARERIEELLQQAGLEPIGKQYLEPVDKQCLEETGKHSLKLAGSNRSKQLRSDSCPQLSGISRARELVLQVSTRDISILRGQHNSNICYFRRVWGIELKVVGNPDLPRREIMLVEF